MRKNIKQQSSSTINEQFKLIQASIDFTEIDHQKQVLLITSPESGSGKSTIASQLAMTYAEKGERTLLIGADMRKPTLHKIFLKKSVPGLANVLINEVDWQAGLQKVALEESMLFLMTSGLIPPNPSHLLASGKMEDLLTELRAHFDIIIIDTPPAILVSDTLALARLVDGIILVCRYHKTSKEKAKETVNKIKLSKTKLLGVVWNGTNHKEQYYY